MKNVKSSVKIKIYLPDIDETNAISELETYTLGYASIMDIRQSLLEHLIIDRNVDVYKVYSEDGFDEAYFKQVLRSK